MKYDHCDVCSALGTRWVLPADDFALVTGEHGSSGAWALCDGCKLAYEQADPDDRAGALLDRALAGLTFSNAPREVREVAGRKLADMYDRLIENVTGPVISDDQWVAECDHAEFIWQDKTTTLREPGYYCDRCGFPQDRMMILPDGQARET